MADLSESAYTEEPVAEACELTELQLAALILPRDQELDEGDQALYDAAVEKVDGMLNLAVATREGKKCGAQGCTEEAVLLIKTADGTTQSCRIHLGQLVEGACEVTPL